MSSSARASSTSEPAASDARPNFWCHQCQTRTTTRPLAQEVCCVTCGSGFVEEMAADDQHFDDDDYEDDDDGMDDQIPFDPFFETLLTAALQPQRAAATGPGSRQTSGWTRRRRSRGQAGQPRIVMGTGDQFLQMLLSNLTGLQFGGAAGPGGFVPVMPLYGNPGDYAWGRGGLDAVVTNLLNQMEGAGPPPMPTDRICDIPKVKINESQAEAKLQCSVCWDDFTVGEEVRKLVCEHIFHENCIVPWLQLHATCPVCRKSQHEPEEEEGHAGQASATLASDFLGPMLGATSSHSMTASRGPSTASAPESATSLGSTISTVLNQFFGMPSPASSTSATSSSTSTSTTTGAGPSSSSSGGSSSGNNRRDSFRDMDLE